MINILSRTATTNAIVWYYFEISLTDYNLVNANPQNIKLRTDTSDEFFISSQIYNDANAFGPKWFTSSSVDLGTNITKYFIVLVKDLNLNFFNVYPIDAISYFIDNTNVGVGFEIVNPYNNIVDGKNIGWTLEPKYITINGPIEADRQYQFDFTVTQLVGTVTKTETFKNKMLLFKGTNKVNIGRLVHRVMERNLDMENFISNNQYAPATVDITVTRIKTTDLSAVDSQTLQIIFYAGWDRAIDKQFLDYECRVIAGVGFWYYSFALVKSGNFVLDGYLNNNLAFSIPIVNTGKTLTVSNSNNSYKPGDKLVLELKETNGANQVFKEFYFFPEGKYKHEILFLNDFNCTDLLTCTGSYKIHSDTEYIQNKTYQNLVDHLENLTTIKETKITINTGWLMLRDVACVEALLRSKYVVLLTNSGSYNLVPVQKQIVNRDLEQGLIEFGLEFIINRESDAAVYM